MPPQTSGSPCAGRMLAASLGRAIFLCPAALPTQVWSARRELAEAEDELGVVGHALRRPGRVPREVDLDLLDAFQVGDDRADVLLDHGSGRAAHRRERVDHLDLRAFDLDVVEEPEL